MPRTGRSASVERIQGSTGAIEEARTRPVVGADFGAAAILTMLGGGTPIFSAPYALSRLNEADNEIDVGPFPLFRNNPNLGSLDLSGVQSQNRPFDLDSVDYGQRPLDLDSIDYGQRPLDFSGFREPKGPSETVQEQFDRTKQRDDRGDFFKQINEIAFTGSGVDSSGFFDSALDRYLSGQYAQFNERTEGLRNQYQDRIDQLQEELTGYKGGLVGVNTAYAEYADDANAILSEAAAVEQEELPASAVVETVDAAYGDFEGIIQDTLKKIDANGNEALAAEMADQMLFMGEIITDTLRGKLASQDDLHRLAGAQAQAMANMAWKDDIYNAEKARFQTELQIKAQIEAKKKAIDAQRLAMTRALEDAQRQFEYDMPSPEELWAFASDEYYKQNGLTEIETGFMKNLWNDIRANNPQAINNFDTFKGEVYLNMNQTNLEKAGLWNQLTALLGSGDLDPTSAGIVEQALRTQDVRSYASLPPLVRVMFDKVFGADVLPRLTNIENPVGIDDAGYSGMLDLWDFYNDFAANYSSDSIQTPDTKWSPDGSYAYPVSGLNWWSGGGFGFEGHEGVDIHAKFNTPIVSAVGGTVTKAGWNGNEGGWAVTVRGTDGKLYYYAHMDRMPSVKVNQTVNAGDMVGFVGDSGNATGTPHLHFGIRDANGRPLNPSTALKATGGSYGTKSPDDLSSGSYTPTAVPSPANTGIGPR
jgi:murein DD-endopeptidase MepM/ murein hydrolase activator NlpD